MNDTLFPQMPSMDGVSTQLVWKTRGDKYIWGIVIVLALISILVVYSATGSLAYRMYNGNNEVYLFKQIIFMLIGLVIIYFMHRVNYTIYSRIAWAVFLFSVPFLIYTYFFGVKINEGSRWVRVPIINLTMQTSDFARLALFMYISRVLSKKQEVIKDFKAGFLPVIIPVFVICGLIAPANLSTALLTGATSLLLMFIGRVSLKHIGMAIGVAAIPVGLLIAVALLTYNDKKSDDSDSSKDAKEVHYAGLGRARTWIKRVQDYRYANKEEEPAQVKQSKIAIANGGILVGLGPGNSRQRNFLPHSYSDFIYSIIIEEYGLLGGGFIIVIYLIFVFRGIRIFKKCPYAW